MNALRRWLTRALPGLCAAVTLGACAAQPLTTKKPPPKYPGRCNLLEIEEIPATVDQSNSIFLIARYSWAENKSAPPRPPLAYRFQVSQNRRDDLRLQLQTSGGIICEPERSSKAANEFAPSFEGQRGQLLPEPAKGQP
jgi:hypothetical protein